MGKIKNNPKHYKFGPIQALFRIIVEELRKLILNREAKVSN